MRLAGTCGLQDIVAARLRVPTDKGANASGKVAAIVAGMVAGADSIDDLDELRHGGMPTLFNGVYAPSTLGSFLRAFTHGHVRQLQRAARQFQVRVAARAPLLPSADAVTFIDVDSLLRRVYGKQKQGAGFGHAKVGGYQVLLRGLNPLVATISTPHAAPVIAATQLRAGNAGSARGAASLVAEAVATTKAVLTAQPATITNAAAAAREIVLRADSAFYSRAVITACRRAVVRFSNTVRIEAKVRAAIATIGEDTWTEIRYPQPVWDDEQQRFISRAQIAETSYTAFEGTRYEVTARLIVRRVPDLKQSTVDEQGELFTVWRYHAAFTDSPYVLVQAEVQHRGHAIIEQVFTELIDGPLAHLPSGRFNTNNAWLACIAIAHNHTRAAATLAGRPHHTARAATIRRHLINVAGRIARHAHEIIIHLPRHWPGNTTGIGCSPPRTPHPPDRPQQTVTHSRRWQPECETSPSRGAHWQPGRSPQHVPTSARDHRLLTSRPPKPHRWISARAAHSDCVHAHHSRNAAASCDGNCLDCRGVPPPPPTPPRPHRMHVAGIAPDDPAPSALPRR
ncbi:transposase [Dactylosporangium matsuzakiense]|uniref:Transposase n=1 Tax=Dactylosporangium matsuzakiense TaxID=53360 RepID=A0A9W6KQ93_9ACTN|nr:transposase [Dactylosporangium matsuzakiense]